METKQGDINKIIKLNIPQFCDLMGVECQHEDVSAFNLKEAPGKAFDEVCNFDFFALYLKHINCGPLQYGMTTYDYDAGTIVCIGPNQVVKLQHKREDPVIDCDTIVFSPALLHGSSLAKKMQRYSFFAYSSNEALHLTDDEQLIVKGCMDKIRREASDETDQHSRDIILMNLELLLEYCLRFYDRQFTTRQEVNRNLLSRFETLLNEYLQKGLQREQGLPTVKYFADKACLSPNYFGDLVKKLTGRTAQEYILNRVVDLGKEMLLGSEDSINDIAYSLGFQYPQHFTRFFKNKTGMTPMEFRKASR